MMIDRTLGGGRSPASPREIIEPPVGALEPTDVVMEDVQGASVSALEASDSNELVRSLNDATRHSRLSLLAWLRGKRSVAVFYDINDEHAQQFDQLLAGFEALARTDSGWQVASQGLVRTPYQKKVNAGASSLVGRSPIAFSREAPKALATNIIVPAVVTQTRSIYFLPDLLLLREGKHFAGFPYAQVTAAVQQTRFIENGRVPRDSQQVDNTWKYVNKNGGPDRRFNNNRQLPILVYAELTLASASGLHTVLQLSSVTAAEEFATAVAGMR